MRTLILALTLAVSFAASAAEYPYIIPMSGYAQGSRNTWFYAETIVQNLSPRPATIRTTSVYPVFSTGTCSMPESFTLQPLERTHIDLGACLMHIAAIELSSNEPLSIRTEVDSHRTRVAGWDRQVIHAATGWIAAGVDSLTEAVISEGGDRRANLLLVNPSATELEVVVEMTRPEFDASRSETIVVAPKSSRLVGLSEIPDPLGPAPIPIERDGRHILRLHANGPYQGGVSSVTAGTSMYVPAVPLAP